MNVFLPVTVYKSRELRIKTGFIWAQFVEKNYAAGVRGIKS